MPIRTQVIELDPDWLLVCFRGSRPPAEERAFALHQALRAWLHQHPGHAIRRTLPVEEAGALVGVHVWLRTAQPLAQRELAVKIHYRLVDRLPREHLEALLHDAYQIFFDQSGARTLAVISRGGNAVVFDRVARCCYLLPLDEMQNLDEDANAKIHEWRLHPGSNYFVMDLGGFDAGEETP